jgi:hypothetical protein
MKVYLAPIAWRTFEATNAMCLMSLTHAPDGHQIRIRAKTGDALIERQRGIAAHLFLQSDCDVMFQIDSDIVFKSESFWTIAEQAYEHGYVGGFYLTRSDQGGVPSTRTLPGVVYDLRHDTLRPVKWLGGGFTCVRRDVLEAVIAQPDVEIGHQGHELEHSTAYYPFVVDEEPDGRTPLSEDWAFSERVNRAGFTNYVNPSVWLGHIGTKIFTMDDLQRDPDGRQVQQFSRDADDSFHLKVAFPIKEEAA